MYNKDCMFCFFKVIYVWDGKINVYRGYVGSINDWSSLGLR